MLSENEKGRKNIVPPLHLCMNTHVYPLKKKKKEQERVSQDIQDIWNNPDSTILFRTAKKQVLNVKAKSVKRCAEGSASRTVGNL